MYPNFFCRHARRWARRFVTLTGPDLLKIAIEHLFENTTCFYLRGAVLRF